ncbi:uncharacterized protein KIAA1143 homolog isoform X2 [Ostrea edulis]|uniref:uncharacterized protein KIAA1143 homolog isoform X2 n=1 Tax=Ostrea edulis TaxID=37623 RepID=UPI00209519E8|nr:uncharacterized protein KIAA1143 homolog isoform X2 [Ostrea edulis]
MPKAKISYVQNDEPDFIKKFKQRVGYKEGPTVDTKREVPNFDEDDDREETDDEKPVVVQLREGDLSAEEVDRLQKPPADGKIKFKKPAKRSGSDTPTELNTSSKKKKEEKSEKKKSGKAVKNSTLLSFNEEEEDAT